MLFPFGWFDYGYVLYVWMMCYFAMDTHSFSLKDVCYKCQLVSRNGYVKYCSYTCMQIVQFKLAGSKVRIDLRVVWS
uniref:Uncharacterized protein n=1 Tax=Arundo donax TaxID=35708 RepID=A0A0A9HHN9_ARUDO